MNKLIEGMVWGELVARRSSVLTGGDRGRVRTRSAALVAAGLPLVIGVADATQEVRRLERRHRPPPEPKPVPKGELAWVAKAQVMVDAFGALAEEAEEQLARMEESIAAGRAALDAHEAALNEAREDAGKLAECAEALEGVFEDAEPQ